MYFVIFTAFLQTISVTPSMTRLYSRLLRSVKLGGTSITQASTLEDAHSNSMLESQQQDSTALREWEPANLKFSKHWFLHTLQGNTGTKLEGFYDLWSSIGLSENREPQYPGFVIQIAMVGYANFQTPWNHCLDIGGEMCVVLLSGSWSLCRWSAEKIDLIMKKTLTTAKVLKDLEDWS